MGVAAGLWGALGPPRPPCDPLPPFTPPPSDYEALDPLDIRGNNTRVRLGGAGGGAGVTSLTSDL